VAPRWVLLEAREHRRPRRVRHRPMTRHSLGTTPCARAGDRSASIRSRRSTTSMSGMTSRRSCSSRACPGRATT
jgi:hypothetical protein